MEAIIGVERKLHETWVEVQQGPKMCRYLVVSYYDRHCPVNRALKKLSPEVDWHGELVVMRGGKTVFVTELGLHRQAEQAVQMYVSLP